ncbi:MAG: type IV pilus secretin PilQ [Bdellovibrionota bacterium]
MISRKKRDLSLAVALLLVAVSAMSADKLEPPERNANVKKVGFYPGPDKSRVEITFDRDVTFEKKVSEEDKQVIIEVPHAKISKRWARVLDTSQQKGSLSLVSPYQSDDGVRVVLQLRDMKDVEVSQDGRKLVAYVPSDGTASPSEEVATAESPEPELALPAETTEAIPPAEAAAPVETATNSTLNSTEPSPVRTAVDGPLDEFFESQRTKSYVGRRISLQVREAELADVFRIISEASEFNIVLSEAVRGRVVLSLSDVPWDQALDLILHSYRLAAERHGNVLRITTLEELTREKQAEATARRATEAAEPVVVKIFPISYARIEDLQRVISDFLSREVGTNTNSGSARGSIQVDSRTNSLIVRDTPSTIEKIKRIIKELDTQTPQVLIEAKFVEVQESHQREVQGRIFATSRELDAATGNYVFRNTRNSFGTLFGGSTFTNFGDTFAVTPPSGGSSLGFSPKAGLFPGIREIGAFLSILESENRAKIIASPRIVTQNRERAEISQGQSIQIATVPGANSSGGFQTINAVLRLEVTPQVTNDGAITMRLIFSQETPSAQSTQGATFSTDTKRVETQVMVDSGATLVIGGIYLSRALESETGIPFLRDLPILGVLFGSRGKQTTKGELFIFLTPRVINETESGIRG